MNIPPRPLTSCAIALSLGAVAQAHAEGFVEDAQARLSLRNHYYNSDNRGSGSAPRQEEWGQGFNLNLQSGFTTGTVGFGIDALALLGVRLDGGGRAGDNASSVTRNPSARAGQGNMFPVDSDNAAVDQFSSLGLTAKLRVSKTEARLGTLQPRLPVVMYNDGRLLPQTFEGAQVTSKEFDNLSLTAGQLNRAKGRASSDKTALSMGGAQKNADTQAFNFAGLDYQLSKDLLAQYYFGNLEDFYQQHFLGLTHKLILGSGSLKSDLRYWYSDADGKNASAQGRDEGYLAAGYYGENSAGAALTRGEVDNRTWSALFTYSLGGHSLGLGYQAVEGNSNFPFINQGDVHPGSSGALTYLITDRQLANFSRAGERTWLAQYDYDFVSIGVPGLTASLAYLKGTDVQSANGELSEWERDFALSYVTQSGPLKGLGVTWKNAAYRSEVVSGVDQNRLILSYSISL